ncbi:uncharacterized protein LOC135840759 [Planococcus citri]|uniref:uncharacterized protein LOC135840759 n=1 Tax=Planococcus citri TaxID=170843 RepID=UPI0031F754A0
MYKHYLYDCIDSSKLPTLSRSNRRLLLNKRTDNVVFMLQKLKNSNQLLILRYFANTCFIALYSAFKVKSNDSQHRIIWVTFNGEFAQFRKEIWESTNFIHKSTRT